MTQKTLIVSFITIIAVFIIYKINVSLALGLDTFVINLFPNKKLPTEFVNYKSLSEIKTFGNHSIAVFYKNKDFSYDLQILEIDNEKIAVKVISKTEHYDNGGGNSGSIYFNTVFKMDTYGKVLDTINYKTSTSNQSEFGDTVLLNKQIVNKDLLYYQTWPTDGDKTKKNFIPINKDLSWTTEKTTDYFYKNILPNAIYLEQFNAWRDDAIPFEQRESLMYYANNQWYVFYGVSSDTYSYARDLSLKQHKNITTENALGKVPDDKIVVKYFHKLNYDCNMAGQTHSNTPYTYYWWDGIAYVNLFFENDVLKFKNENVNLDDYDTNENSKSETKKENYEEMEKDLKSKYNFYSNPNLKFSLITDDESNDLYIIKKNK